MMAVEKDSEIEYKCLLTVSRQQQWLRQRNRWKWQSALRKHPTGNVSENIWLKCRIG